MKPDLPGHFYRTTLVQGAGGKWFVLELCEQLEGLVQLDSGFHEMKGRRNVITFITDPGKDPCVLGFTLADSPPERFPVEPEEDVEIPDIEPPVERADIPEGQIVIQPKPEDEVNVNGTVLRESSNFPHCVLDVLFTSCPQVVRR